MKEMEGTGKKAIFDIIRFDLMASDKAFFPSSCAYLFLLLAQQPPVGQGLLIHEVSRSHTTTHDTRQDSSGRVISSLHRPLPDNTQHSQQGNMRPVDSNPQSQQASGRRPTPQTAWSLGQAPCAYRIYRVSQEECARLREGVPYVKVYRYNPKHLCSKLNGCGDNGQGSLKL